ncbi:hypothetical protein GCM10011506_25240 [Marivirga lumbricoides]|uniref:ABC transporter permease n=1 Tax=Marivirga lumbricoides TaxID=1046115 RepID=A0ABQ1MFA2_9BACT|nr:hypothetical protein GCM10011506_25240 [Marivirga lumbricoides]
MQKLLKLALMDFKLIFRDPSLKSFLALPLLLFAIVIFGFPYLVTEFEGVKPYLDVMMVVVLVENTQMFCFINSMVLLDEKETEVSKVYGIVPLSIFEFITSRFLFPYLFTLLLNVAMLEVQTFYEVPLMQNLLLSAIAALIVPVYALGINSFVKNRMQGMVYAKAFNILVLIPFAAFFVPEQFKWAFGLFPTHWLFQGMDQLLAGNSPFLNLGIATAYLLILLIVLSKTFKRSHFS